jgi:predicted Zn-dependent peptidase
VTQEEFAQAKEQLMCGYVLGQESTTARMMSIGRAQLLKDEVLDQNEVLNRIKATTLDEVNELAREVFHKAWAASAVGPSLDLDFAPFSG